MDKQRRKELLEEYKQIKIFMGVIQITNKINGKIYVDSYPNLQNKWGAIQTQLNMGMFVNAQKKCSHSGTEDITSRRRHNARSLVRIHASINT